MGAIPLAEGGVNVLDLFSGIGGFSLGLERAGMRTVAFCEIEPYCRAVLRKHWPTVSCYEDVRTLTAERLSADGIAVDLICGGFPCQDISVAGKGAGIEGERSGLWSEYARLIGEIRPRFVIVENVAALLGRGMGRVLGDLAEIGYDAEWNCISAADVGAPHRRERIWIVAYSSDSEGARFGQHGGTILSKQKSVRSGGSGQSLAYGYSQRLALGRIIAATSAVGGHRLGSRSRSRSRSDGDGIASSEQNGPMAYANERRLSQPEPESGEERTSGTSKRPCLASGGWWSAEPNVGRVADGVPRRVDRLRGLGNAVVPQIPEIIGRAILATQEEIGL